MADQTNTNFESGVEASPDVGIEKSETKIEVNVDSGTEIYSKDKNGKVEGEKIIQEVDEIAKPAPAPVVGLSDKDQLSKDIEEILSDDLTDLYLSMPKERQQAFKIKGEEITLIIKEMMQKGKVEANKILGLILSWLGMIPGINRFFLQQEAKIKTDLIVERYETEISAN